MTLYAKIDTSFARDPKMLRVGPMSRLLYLQFVAFSREVLSDGFVTREQLQLVSIDIPQPIRYVHKLVAEGLLDETGEGWRIPEHVWRKWNPTKAEVEANRAAEAERKARYRDARRDGGVPSGHDPDRDGGVPPGHPRTRDAAATDSQSQSQSQSQSNTPPTPLNGSSPVPANTAGRGQGPDGPILNACLALELRTRSTSRDPISDPDRWLKTMRTKRWAQWGAEIVRLHARFPTAPPDIIAAAVVNGEKQSLRYYAS